MTDCWGGEAGGEPVNTTIISDPRSGVSLLPLGGVVSEPECAQDSATYEMNLATYFIAFFFALGPPGVSLDAPAAKRPNGEPASRQTRHTANRPCGEPAKRRTGFTANRVDALSPWQQVFAIAVTTTTLTQRTSLMTDWILYTIILLLNLDRADLLSCAIA